MSAMTNLYTKIYTKLDHTICMVTVNKRFVAYLVDWFVGFLFMFIIPIYVYSVLTGSTEMQDAMNFEKFPDPYPLIMALVVVVMFFIYFVFIPSKVWKGQTFAKKNSGFKVVKLDGSDVTMWTMFKREFIGVAIIEGGMFSISNVLHQILLLVTGIDLLWILMIIGYLITAISCMMVMLFSSRRMLHDYIAGTKVIPVEKQ